MKHLILQLLGAALLLLGMSGCLTTDPVASDPDEGEPAERGAADANDWRLAGETATAYQPLDPDGQMPVTEYTAGNYSHLPDFEEQGGTAGVPSPGLDPNVPVFLGHVSLVNEESRFVLIKTAMNRKYRKGIQLQSFHQGQLSAELRFSPEQTHGFMTADIADGMPRVGDDVFLRRTPGFGSGQSPRMAQAMAEFEREREMGYFERRRYKRAKEKAAKAQRKKRAEAAARGL